MTAIPEIHERYGGLLTIKGDRRVVAHYGRPERTYDAVRNVAGVIEHGVGVLSVEGPNHRDGLAGSLTNELPAEDNGNYGFVLRDGRIVADVYVFDVGDRILGFVPSGRIDAIVERWSGDGRTVTETTREMTVFGVYGPQATEKIASVCSATTPETPLSIARGAIREAGVTVIRNDGLAGEEGYLLAVESEEAEDVFDALVNRGLNAAPFGYETWETLTLEAGTPLFRTELRDREPTTVGVTNAFPDDSGPEPAAQQLCGFTAEQIPDPNATVYANGEKVGSVTRSKESPTVETAIGFAVVDRDVGDKWTIGDGNIDAKAATLPFVEGSERSARIPSLL
ncbi:glycine cleavage T C-terminal barrel domain-containing protein [Halorhabdus amylolytica]|uniref:glycine cleavage T C-terminal barrel domain-containing protein n=1 Tax=Halorhabdus amylolytica TaxID=2559573 RepID=UPI0010AAF08D|nr:glycine cleavage T C-terminal barrel domain-containing protein [Halorhabdus amylolytica]